MNSDDAAQTHSIAQTDRPFRRTKAAWVAAIGLAATAAATCLAATTPITAVR